MDYTTEDIKEARQPIASLISKSVKAQEKLAPGTWQHATLRDNIKMLHLASALLNMTTDHADDVTPDDLPAARRALAVLIRKTEHSEAGFSPGTSQHTLLRNRLKALRVVEALMEMELDRI